MRCNFSSICRAVSSDAASAALSAATSPVRLVSWACSSRCWRWTRESTVTPPSNVATRIEQTMRTAFVAFMAFGARRAVLR